MPTVLLTGANRGIGHELARQYCAAGWQVLAVGRTGETTAALQSLLKSFEGMLDLTTVDLAQSDSISELEKWVGKRPIDLLINNAALNGTEQNMMRPFGRLEFFHWSELFAVNTIAPIRLAQSFAGNLQAGTAPKLINISSTISIRVFPNEASLRPDAVPAAAPDKHLPPAGYAYRATKAALNFLSRQLALDLAPRGIVVGLVCPGQVRTGQGGPFAPLAVEESARFVRRVIDGFSARTSGNFYAHTGELLVKYDGPPLEQFWREPQAL